MSDTVYRAGMKCKKLAVALVFMYALTQFSNTSHAAPMSADAKAQSVRAVQLIERGQWDQARQIIHQTRDPVAAKLFFWLYYTRQDKDIDFIKLAQFIRQNPSWPGIEELRSKAERNVPVNLPPAEIIAWFDDYTPLTAKGSDRYLTAILQSGNIPKAREYLSNWWASATLSRDDQRDLFRKYNQYINTSAHHKRLDMLLLNGQNENAMAIANVLQQGYPALAQARMGLASDAGNVNQLIRSVPPSLQNDPGLLYERLKWRRRNNLNEEAIQILNQKLGIEQIQNPADWWLERHIIIRRLLEVKDYRRAYALAANHKLTEGLPFAQAEWMAGWLALRFMKQPEQGLAHFQKLYANVSAPISKSRAAYWVGRSYMALGQTEQGQKWYQDAAQYRTTFYGQVAAAELSLKGEILSAAPPVLNPAERQAFLADELVQIAGIFNAAGSTRQSGRFLRAFVKHHNTAPAYLFAADTAIQMKQLQDAINISKDATSNGLFLTAQSYPVITDQLNGVRQEWALVHSLIRQESVFNFEARSPAGALGLMQVMPTTAQETARKMGMQHSTDWLTSRPSHNIKIGTYYLQQMLDRYDGAYPLAIAAYNAGPGRVDNWVKTFGDPRTGEVDVIDWIELMPIYETRNYVQRVVEGTYVYRLRLKDVQPPVQNISMATPINLKDM